MMSKKRFIVLLADGARHDVLSELLAEGRLPNIEEVFLSEGSFAKGTTVFPSTTGPAYMPFLTGCFPGTCHVPGIRWFDKEVFARKKISLHRFRSYVGLESLLMNRDISKDVTTLFEHFPKSYNIFSPVNRGVSKKGKIHSHMRLWYWYYSHLTDRWHLADQEALAKGLSVVKQDFEFLFFVFPGIDEYAHLSHPRHPSTLEAYERVDQGIGKIVAELKRQGKYEETALFVVSDHGLSAVSRHFGVESYLESKDLKVFYYPKILKKSFSVASMVSGNGMLHLYFKGRQGWGRRLSFNEVREMYPSALDGLLSHPAVDLIASQGPDAWVYVVTRQGEMALKEDNGKISVRHLSGDALGLKLQASEFTFRQALEATIDTGYPDALMQLLQVFRSSRSGDLVLSAAKGYDLRKRFEYPEHKSSHGALHNEHMLIPILSNVKMSRNVVRSADLFPSILHLHGDAIPEHLDGESFFY